MGNIFSSEEKLLRRHVKEINTRNNLEKINGIHGQYGNYQTNRLFIKEKAQIQNTPHRYKRRNISFHGRYGKNEYLKSKSHSLNAILEDLYMFKPEEYGEEKETKIKFETGGSLIPRIKLRRSTSSLTEGKTYTALCKMSSESEIIIEDSSDSSLNVLLKKENADVNANRAENNITILLNDETYNEISSKSDENYFTKNFDDCMKRLEQIEKEHELIENEEKDVQFSIFSKQKSKIQNDTVEPIVNYKSECEFNSCGNGSAEEKDINLESQFQNCKNNNRENVENCLKDNSVSTENMQTQQTEENCTFTEENKQPVSVSWYSNLKQQFEKTDKEKQEPKTKEMSCRITGATLKSYQNEKSESEDKEKNTRHYFSRLVKTNKSLIDEELPDPDKVKHIRAMFQETLNSTLKRKLDKKLGGSLQNISFRTVEQQMSRPLSAQCYRHELFCETPNSHKSDEEKEKPTGETSKPLKADGNGEFQIENVKKKLFEKYERDLKVGKECKNKRILQAKWTDTGSVSSGISSDLSSYDTDLESYSREGTEQDEIIISDDDLLEEMKDKHYVQNEVLEKIRSFGTSVTYYGGEMITCSIGPLLSPTTQAIMEEISENYGNETSTIRSFDEFYRKYKETNEPNRKKKVGRTRSFGQNDVFQKPNVLNNTEIELYKNDLEIEIGIKKPAGIPQNSLKKKSVEPARSEIQTETLEKPKEKCRDILTSSGECDVLCNSSKKTETSEKDLVTECDTVNNNLTEETSSVINPVAENKIEEETENKTTNKKPESNEETTKEEALKSSFDKDRFYLRSKSVPEDLLNGKTTSSKCEIVSKNIEHPSKEIYFSYEKSIFNKKVNSDMEFEEFEVCEFLSEKLEKLEKKNSFDKTNQETLTSATQIEESQEKFQENSDEERNLSQTVAEEENPEIKENQEIHLIGQKIETPMENDYNQGEKKDLKYNYTKWPIETSVMVDIQKSSEQTPKLISSGKTVAKTKIRLF